MIDKRPGQKVQLGTVMYYDIDGCQKPATHRFVAVPGRFIDISRTFGNIYRPNVSANGESQIHHTGRDRCLLCIHCRFGGQILSQRSLDENRLWRA